MLMGTRLPVLWRIESAAHATAFWTNYLYHGLHAGHKAAPDANGPFKIFIVGTGRSGTHWLGTYWPPILRFMSWSRNRQSSHG